MFDQPRSERRTDKQIVQSISTIKSEVTEPSNAELISMHPEIVAEETRRASGRIQRKAAHQASEKIKNIAYLESIIEE